MRERARGAGKLLRRRVKDCEVDPVTCSTSQAAQRTKRATAVLAAEKKVSQLHFFPTA